MAISYRNRAVKKDTTVSPHELENIIKLALRAPSVADRKPWQFRIVGNVIELYTTPVGEVASSPRMRYVSGGALLQYVRLIIRNKGRKEIIQMFPRLDNPDLMAYIRMNGDHQPAKDEQLLNGVLKGEEQPRKNCQEWCRENFKAAIRQTGKQTNTTITLFNSDTAPQLTGKLDRYVKAQKSDNIKAIRQLADEMRLKKINDTTGLEQLCSFNNIDFSDGMLVCGIEEVQEDSPSEYVLINANVENSYSWIAAGEAMARVHLYLKLCGLFGMVVLPIIEDPEARAWLAENMPAAGWPQVLLKLGRIEKMIDHSPGNINEYIRKPGL